MAGAKKATRSASKKSTAKFPRWIYATASPHSLGGLSMFEADSLITAETVGNFDSDPGLVAAAVERLEAANFEVMGANTGMIYFCGSRTAFERAFGTSLISEERSVIKGGGLEDTATFFDSVETDLSGFIDPAGTSFADVLEGIAIEEPYYPMAQALPPTVDSWYLSVPSGVSLALNADKAHRSGWTGRGVKVAMVDTGWFRHPFFTDRGYRAERAVLAPGADNPDDDENGHGTGESANVFAAAPDCELLPVKAANASGALVNMTAALNEAIALGPDIITNSWGASVQDGPLSAAQQAQAAVIAAAVASGVVICFSAGNGHWGFPGQHPDVISVGGVFRQEDGGLRASDYSSGFVSNVYAGRQSPDVCGLVGMQPGANYIMLPVQDGDDIDVGKAAGGGPTPPDGTSGSDGWALFSGTSAACPQIAGVIALLKQVCPDLTAFEIREILQNTAIDVTEGSSHPNTPGSTSAGPDTATGSGLVDAAKAVAVARLRCLVPSPEVQTTYDQPEPPMQAPRATAPGAPLRPLKPLRPLSGSSLVVRPFLEVAAAPSLSPPLTQQASRTHARRGGPAGLTSGEVAYLEQLLIDTDGDFLGGF